MKENASRLDIDTFVKLIGACLSALNKEAQRDSAVRYVGLFLIWRSTRRVVFLSRTSCFDVDHRWQWTSLPGSHAESRKTNRFCTSQAIQSLFQAGVALWLVSVMAWNYLRPCRNFQISKPTTDCCSTILDKYVLSLVYRHFGLFRLYFYRIDSEILPKCTLKPLTDVNINFLMVYAIIKCISYIRYAILTGTYFRQRYIRWVTCIKKWTGARFTNYLQFTTMATSILGIASLL